jgi:Fic family protein
MIKKHERQNLLIKILKDSGNLQISHFSPILKKYNIDVDDRTILRDLNDLIDQNFISKKGTAKSTYYYISDSNKIFENIDIEEYFRKEYEKREVQESFNFEIFDSLQKDIFSSEEQAKLQDLQAKFIKNISKYDSQTLINKEYERIMIEFSWKSSAIEWNTYSLLNTEALIKDNIKDESKTPEETQMILNHKDGFNETIQNRERFLHLKCGDIEYIHWILTKKLDVTKNIRKHGVGVTGTKYKPLDNEFQIKEALEKTTKLINKKKSFFEKAFIALILISYIQPFEDGNKRTARMFSNAILLAHNSIPLSYRIIDIVEYKKASILFYEINNVSYFKKIFIDQFEDAVNNYFN